jgi:hypothetical protein
MMLRNDRAQNHPRESPTEGARENDPANGNRPHEKPFIQLAAGLCGKAPAA